MWVQLQFSILFHHNRWEHHTHTTAPTFQTILIINKPLHISAKSLQHQLGSGEYLSKNCEQWTPPSSEQNALAKRVHSIYLHLHKYCKGFHITRRNDVISGAFQTWVLVRVHVFTVCSGFEATLGGCLLWWLVYYDWQLVSTSAAKNLDSLCVYWFPDDTFKTVSTLCHDGRFWK